MRDEKVRRQIAWEAARLMYCGQESEYYQAKMKAGRKVCQGWVRPIHLPSNSEIREELLLQARIHEGPGRVKRLRDMRVEALRLMRRLEAFRPRLIGSTLTGHVRAGSDVDVHVFADGVEPIVSVLEEDRLDYEVIRKRVRKLGEERTYTHIHVTGEFAIEITLYARARLREAFRCSITGKRLRRASIAELEELIAAEHPEVDLDEDALEAAAQVDRYAAITSLLLPLEEVKQHPRHHPEGDVLYHSLQVFDLAVDQAPYDEELLAAALLHDVGKGIDPADHVASALSALEGLVTERTLWLIAHHMEAHAAHDGTLGARRRKRLAASPDYDDLMLLGECDRAGRRRGVETRSLEEAVEYLRKLDAECR